jgi:aryl-alcohol dehydrogenase-like predicted oxidoreductase
LKIALGTAQFGLDYGVANQRGKVSRSDAQSILDHAWQCGIDTLDTAVAYGDSEQRLGEIGIRDWQVISKMPGIPANCTDVSRWMSDSVTEALGRLNVEHLFGLLLHRPQQLLESDGEQLYRALQQLKSSGLVTKIGVSIYDPTELDPLLERYPMDIVQAPFNIIDRRLIDTGWMSRMSELGIELHVRSVFLQGLLLMTPSARPLAFSRWASLWENWQNWLIQSEMNPLQACLRHALSFPEITKVIVGLDSLGHLQEILGAIPGPMPQIPTELHCNDVDLLNPSRWTSP